MKIRQILSEARGRHITHIEDLPIEQFIDAVRNLNLYNISEKIDGFNLKFGIDETGFYVQSKSAFRKYRTSDEWGDDFRWTGFRSAHKALAEILPEILKLNLMKVGDEIEAEVLFGERPNTIPYNNANKIVILKATEGDPDINQIKNTIKGKTAVVTIKTPKTQDGRNVTRSIQQHEWTFDNVPRVSINVTNIIEKHNLEARLSQLESFLHQESYVHNFSNAEVLALPLNKRPPKVESKDWKDVKGKIKKERIKIAKQMSNFKLDIKEILLDEMVRHIGSKFGPEVKEGGWIEGVVLARDKEDEKEVATLIKIVDKDVFTALNKFYWHVRNNLSATPKGENDVKSIIGQTKMIMAKVIGHPELATIRRRKYLKKHELTVENIAKDLKYQRVKEVFKRALERGEELTSRYHTIYNKMKQHAYKDIDFGEMKRRFDIDEHVDEKNLESFAELYSVLGAMKEKVEKSYTTEDLIRVLLGDIVEEEKKEDSFESKNTDKKSLNEFSNWIINYET